MNKLLFFIVLSISLALQACSNDQSQAVAMTLDKPVLTKAINSSNIAAELYFDGTFDQTIYFDDASAKTITFDLVSPDQSIDVLIYWYEEIDDTFLLLSRQTGNFLVTPNNPNININSEHFTSFDWDGDRASNISERRNGTCPYLACDQNGFLIKPDDVSTIELEDNFSDIVFNGGDSWATNGKALRTIGKSRSNITLEYLTECVSCNPFRGIQVKLSLATRSVSINTNENDDSEFVTETRISRVE